MLNWTCSLVKDGADARKLAYNYARYASSQNIMYAEVMTNPTHWKSLSYQDLIENILQGFDQAYDDGYCDCRLLVSLLRSQTRRESLELVRYMTAHRHPRRWVSPWTATKQLPPSPARCFMRHSWKPEMPVSASRSMQRILSCQKG